LSLQVAPFKAIMKSAQHYDKIQRVRIKDKEVEAFVPAYQVRLPLLHSPLRPSRLSFLLPHVQIQSS
jgi:hypothetical protein